jgi:hypothetical protein
MPKRHLTAIAIFLAAFSGSSATATDGVIELNHTCATASGCLPGDAPGYPITIDGATGRSFRLTSDLRVPDATDGILLATSRATIDLNGFAIARDCYLSNTQAGSIPVLCLLAEAGSGVNVLDFQNNLGNAVIDGSVAFMGGAGIRLGHQSRVDAVRVHGVGGTGIASGIDSAVSNCIVDQTGDYGIRASGLIADNVVKQTGNDGISTVGSSTVRANRVQSSATWGIATSASSSITDNSVSYSGSFGIRAGSDSVVSRNAVSYNGSDGILAVGGASVSDNSVNENGGQGIKCTGGCRVDGNSVANNANWQLFFENFGDPSSYRNNNIVSGTGTTVTGGFDAGGNACDGNATCP